MFVFQSDDYIGQQFGELTIVKFVERKEIKSSINDNGKMRKRFLQMFLCRCSCGGERIASLQELKSGKVTRCKNCRKSKLLGRVYGKLTIVDIARKAYVDEEGKKYGAIVKVQCSCGNNLVVYASALSNKVSPKVSCGKC